MTAVNQSTSRPSSNPSTTSYRPTAEAAPDAVADAGADEDFWRESFKSRPYVKEDASFDDYGPAYRYGAQAYARHAPMGTWTEAEARLGMGWEEARGTSSLGWAEAREAAHDAWERMKRRAVGLR